MPSPRRSSPKDGVRRYFLNIVACFSAMSVKRGDFSLSRTLIQLNIFLQSNYYLFELAGHGSNSGYFNIIIMSRKYAI